MDLPDGVGVLGSNALVGGEGASVGSRAGRWQGRQSLPRLTTSPHYPAPGSYCREGATGLDLLAFSFPEAEIQLFR